MPTRSIARPVPIIPVLLGLILVACGSRTPTPAETAPPIVEPTATAGALPPGSELVEAMTASGWEVPRNIDAFPADKKGKPAAQAYTDVKLLGDVPAETFIAGMQSMEPALGWGCDGCHDTENFAADTEHKNEARQMLVLAHSINRDFFGGKTEVSCFTCHHGSDHPASKLPDDMTPVAPTAPVPVLTDEQKQKPAEEVYGNIQILKGIPAEGVVRIMGVFSYVLGEDCDFCHDTADWAADTNDQKKVARDMMSMVGQINAKAFGGEAKVGCWTCHRGRAHPLKKPE